MTEFTIAFAAWIIVGVVFVLVARHRRLEAQIQWQLQFLDARIARLAALLDRLEAEDDTASYDDETGE